MSLNRKLQLLQQNILKSLPADVCKKLIEENRKLFNEFLLTKALQPGMPAPDVLFRDKNLDSVYLSDILKNKHVVLSFFRGTWCPYCTMELHALEQIKGQVESKGAVILAVSPELYQYSAEVINKEQIGLPILTDLGNKSASEFGLVFELPASYREFYELSNLHLNILNGDNSWTLPVPATFIISGEGIISATYINVDYTQRMEPDDILRALDQLQA